MKVFGRNSGTIIAVVQYIGRALSQERSADPDNYWTYVKRFEAELDIGGVSPLPCVAAMDPTDTAWLVPAAIDVHFDSVEGKQ